MDLQPRQRAVARRLWVALGAALTLAPLVPAAAQAAPSKEAAALPGGFGVRPVVPKGRDLPPSYFVIKAGPGSIAERSVVIVNGTKTTKSVIVDGVDGLTGQTTGVVYANRDERHLEASRWVRPAKRKLHVKPGTTRRMRFTVRVPKDARPGDHVAGLAFEDAKPTTSKSRFAVKQVVRVVVGVHIHIDGGKPGQVTLGKMALEAQPGTQVATTLVRMKNEGDKLCKPKLAVTLQPQNGAPRTEERQLDTVLPGDQIDYPMQFDGQVDAGTYGAKATVTDCGDEQVIAANVNLGNSLDGSSPRADAPAATSRDPLGIPSWALIAGLVTLGIGSGIGGLLGLQALARRRAGGAESTA